MNKEKFVIDEVLWDQLLKGSQEIKQYNKKNRGCALLGVVHDVPDDILKRISSFLWNKGINPDRFSIVLGQKRFYSVFLPQGSCGVLYADSLVTVKIRYGYDKSGKIVVPYNASDSLLNYIAYVIAKNFDGIKELLKVYEVDFNRTVNRLENSDEWRRLMQISSALPMVYAGLSDKHTAAFLMADAQCNMSQLSLDDYELIVRIAMLQSLVKD